MCLSSTNTYGGAHQMESVPSLNAESTVSAPFVPVGVDYGGAARHMLKAGYSAAAS